MLRISRNRRKGFWLALFVLVLFVCGPSRALAQVQLQGASAEKSMLFLYAFEAHLPVFEKTNQGILAALETGGVSIRSVFFEYLDLARNTGPEHRQRLAELMRQRYSQRKIDMIVTLYPEALRFVINEGRAISPAAPILALYLPQGFQLPKRQHPIVAHSAHDSYDLVGTLEAALKLVPGVKHVYVVCGAHENDRALEKRIRRDLKLWEDHLEFRYLSDMPLETILATVSSTPPETIVFFGTFSADVSGRNYTSREVVQQLSRISSVPVFGLHDVLLGYGIVGGSLLSFERTGAEAGKMILSGLQTTQGSMNPVSLAVPAVPMFDWRQLRRWNLSVDGVPQGSIIINREYTLWERYRTAVLAALFALVVQALLIVGLVVNRAQRQEAERQLAEQLRLQTLLAELSARFVHLPASQIESEIQDAQRHICAGLALERSTLWQVPSDAPGTLRLTHVHAPLESPPLLPGIDASDLFPWATQQLLRGESLTLSTLAALPPEAARDRATFQRYGTKSTVVLPLFADGAVVGALSFATARAERAWHDDVVNGFRMAAEMMANAIARGRADRALQESQARLTLAAASADARLWEVEADTERVWLMEPGRAFFGVAPDEPLTLDRLSEFIHPDDRGAWRHSVRQALADGEDLRAEFRVVRPDGSVRWFISQGRLQGGGAGRPSRVLGVTIDITERKHAEDVLRESEARFRNMADTAPVLVWMSGVDKLCTYFNRQWLDFTGRTLAQEVGNGWTEGVHPGDRERCLEAYATAFDARQAFDMEYRLRRADGEYRWLADRGVPRISPAGEFLGYIGSCIDITERQHAEERLRTSRDQLRALAAELTRAEQRERRRLAEFLHDGLQQILVAARLRATMLGQSRDPQVQHESEEVVALLQEAVTQARTLTGELSPPTLRRGGLPPALAWLSGWMKEKHRLTMRLHTPATPLPTLPEDLAGLLYQAVRELLFNVVKHAQTPAADVTLAQVGATMQVTVADAGIGFDPSRLRLRGFGLLSIRERLELLGGRLDIASTPGQGSQFTLWVPLQSAGREFPDSTAASVPPSPAPRVAPPAARRKLRILLVDDHAMVRKGFTRLLSFEPDLEVVGEAADGQAAVELAYQLQPDVVTIDVNLPVLDGIEATRQIRAQCPAVRVIGLSLFDRTEQARAMLEAGAAACVTKGGPVEELLTAIRGE